MLGENERAMWITVDTRSFVASLVQAGDNVSFLVPKLSGRCRFPPTALVPPPVADSPRSSAVPHSGPRNRMGTVEVMRAAGMSPAQENVMAVAVKLVNNSFDEQTRRLTEMGNLPVQVLLHPDAKKP